MKGPLLKQIKIKKPCPSSCPHVPKPAVPPPSPHLRGERRPAARKAWPAALYLVAQDGSEVLLHQDQQRRGRAAGGTRKGLLSRGRCLPACLFGKAKVRKRISPLSQGPGIPIPHPAWAAHGAGTLVPTDEETEPQRRGH